MNSAAVMRGILISALLFPLLATAQSTEPRATTCSTVLLKGTSSLLVGHNLDEVFHTPGWLIVSPRGVARRDVCGHELLGQTCPTPDLQWIARYGSVAFGFSADLADGGMNEAGLTINEMGLAETRHPFHSDRPTLLTRLWIRYQLDMFASVEEVIAHLDSLNIDGNNLYAPIAVTRAHYFITDARGQYAVIEFLDGKAVVRTGDAADVPVLCNDVYSRERAALKRYWRFGGWMPIFETLMSTYPRFVQGAYLSSAYVERTSAENVSYAFDMLGTMQRPDTKQWSIVYDVKERRAWFRTVKGPSVRFLDMDDLSFGSQEPIRILTDIHADGTGDMLPRLVTWSAKAQEDLISHLITTYASWVAHNNGWTDIDAYLNMEESGLDLDRYIQRAVRAAAMMHR